MRRYTYLFLLILFSFALSAQLPEYYSKHKRYTNYYSKLSFHGYFDCFRQVGIGLEYSPNPKMSIEGNIFGIYPYGPASKIIGYDDYFVNMGGGISIFPKFYTKGCNKGLYYGINLYAAGMSYKNKWIEHYNGEDISSTLRDNKSNAFHLGILCLGYKRNFKNIGYEFFGSIGPTFSNNYSTIKNSTHSYGYQVYPYSGSYKDKYLDGMAGIKITYGLHKKKHFTRKAYLKYFENELLSQGLIEKKKATLFVSSFYLLFFQPLIDSMNKKYFPNERVIKSAYKHYYNDEQKMVEVVKEQIEQFKIDRQSDRRGSQ